MFGLEDELQEEIEELTSVVQAIIECPIGPDDRDTLLALKRKASKLLHNDQEAWHKFDYDVENPTPDDEDKLSKWWKFIREDS